MNKKKIIIVTGGAGYIGSHCVISLIDLGYVPIIIDNFSNSFPNVIKKIEKITKKKVIYFNVDLKNTYKIKSIFKITDLEQRGNRNLGNTGITFFISDKNYYIKK